MASEYIKRAARRFIPLALALLLLFSSCATPEGPDLEALGWEEDWETVGTVAAVEPPEGFTAAENLDIMAGQGLWYAAWTCGEGREIKNEDGEDAVLYDAQLYLLIKACDSAAAAAAETSLWQERERGSYDCSDPIPEEHGGAAYTLMTMTAPEDNPFDGGAAAFAAVGSYAVSVELMVLESAPIVLEDTLRAFLDGLHFNFEEA